MPKSKKPAPTGGKKAAAPKKVVKPQDKHARALKRAIKKAEVIAFADLGMEAIYEFTVEDMPVTVAVDSEGKNVHTLAPKVWQEKIEKEHLLA